MSETNFWLNFSISQNFSLCSVVSELTFVKVLPKFAMTGNIPSGNTILWSSSMFFLVRNYYINIEKIIMLDMTEWPT